MKITQKYRLSTIVVSTLCCITALSQGTYTKLSESIEVNPDVVINLNASHTNVIFESWNKSTVGIEAYVEGVFEDFEAAQYALDSWRMEVAGTSRELTINSATNYQRRRPLASSNILLTDDFEQLKMISPVIADILEPLMQNIENNPMPNALSDETVTSVGLGKNDSNQEEKYLRQWEEQFKSQNQKSQLSNQLEDKKAIVGGQMQIQMQAWTNEYGEQMQAWASRFIQEAQQGDIDNVTVTHYQNLGPEITHTVNKIIKVKIPYQANLRLNVRHGAVKLAEKTTNLIASLSHTKLEAKTIDGNQTYVKASFSPVQVTYWNAGKLIINYVKNCKIQKAKNIQVNSDSSNIYIQELGNNGLITGSFGAITIANLSRMFSTLDLAVENSDFKLTLPKTDFNLVYTGTHSRLQVPKILQTNVRRNFRTVFVNGFQGTRDTDKSITINAKYSDVVLQQ